MIQAAMPRLLQIDCGLEMTAFAIRLEAVNIRPDFE